MSPVPARRGVQSGVRTARRTLVAACAAGIALSAVAGAAGPAGGGAMSPAEVQALLQRVQDATQRHSFSGVYVVTSSAGVSSSRIVHLAHGREQIERIEALDGQKRTAFRHNDSVHIFWPREHEATVQQREHVLDFPSPLASTAVAGLPMYQVQLTGDDRIAGLDTQVLTLRPRDSLRFAQRWWLDRQTGLLLRSDTLGEHGEVIESAAFTEFQLGTRWSGPQLLQEMNRFDGYRVHRPVVIRTDLDREGWRLRDPVSGFEHISCVRRPAPLRVRSPGAGAAASQTAAASGGVAASSLLQSIFSDGLTHVSLFIEPYNAMLHTSESPASLGATHVLPRRVGEWWVTAVGDVPPATLRQFAAGLERRKP